MIPDAKFAELFLDVELESLRTLKSLKGLAAHRVKLFYLAKYLTEMEDQLKGPGQEIPFHSLMSANSDFYTRIFKKAQRLKIKFVPVLKSPEHFLDSFVPLGTTCEFPAIKSHLHWLFKGPTSARRINEVYRVLHYNFPVVHDLIHLILYRSISITAPGEIRNYYLFTEAMAFIQDGRISAELGRGLARSMRILKCMHREEGDIPKGLTDREIFLGNLLSCLGHLEGRSDREIQKALPRSIPWLTGEHLRFKKDFSRTVVPVWLKQNMYLAPKALQGNGIRMKKCDFLGLTKDIGQLNVVWDWYKANMLDC